MRFLVYLVPSSINIAKSKHVSGFLLVFMVREIQYSDFTVFLFVVNFISPLPFCNY